MSTSLGAHAKINALFVKISIAGDCHLSLENSRNRIFSIQTARVYLKTSMQLSRESGEKKTKCGWIAPCTHSDGPVSQTCLLRLLRESWLRAVTLDDSTPQRRISELRVWSYEPFIVFAPSSSGYTSGQNLKALYILITEIIKTYQEIMRFIPRN
jgi:hypothetical protein